MPGPSLSNGKAVRLRAQTVICNILVPVVNPGGRSEDSTVINGHRCQPKPATMESHSIVTPWCKFG